MPNLLIGEEGPTAGANYIPLVASIIGVPEAVPSARIFAGGPTLAQCVGTHRLWGPDLASAYCAEIGQPKIEGSLKEVIALGRSYLVIADYMVDDSARFGEYSAAREALSKISEHIQQSAHRLNFNSEDLAARLERFSDGLSVFLCDSPENCSATNRMRIQRQSR